MTSPTPLPAESESLRGKDPMDLLEVPLVYRTDVDRYEYDVRGSFTRRNGTGWEVQMQGGSFEWEVDEQEMREMLEDSHLAPVE